MNNNSVMRVFRVHNPSNTRRKLPNAPMRRATCANIAAKDESDAMEYAKKIGHVTGRERKQITISDITDGLRGQNGIQDILAAGQTTVILPAVEVGTGIPTWYPVGNPAAHP